jgi:hypothetical protein
MEKWQAIVNTPMNLQVPQNEGNFLTGSELLASQGLSSIKLVNCKYLTTRNSGQSLDL